MIETCCKSFFYSFFVSHWFIVNFKHDIKAWLFLKEWKFKLYAIIIHSKFFVFVFQYWSIHNHAMYLWCLNHWETSYGDSFYTWKLKLYFCFASNCFVRHHFRIDCHQTLRLKELFFKQVLMNIIYLWRKTSWFVREYFKMSLIFSYIM